MASPDFKPVPYTFTLVDFFNKPLLLNEDMRSCILAPCPPFHILLDHTIAVLWLLFSDDESCPLRCAHINWALKFLQGMINESKTTRYAEDTRKAIECLESVLVNFLGDETTVVEACDSTKVKGLLCEETCEEADYVDDAEEESEGYFNATTEADAKRPEGVNAKAVYKSVLLNAMLINGI